MDKATLSTLDQQLQDALQVGEQMCEEFMQLAQAMQQDVDNSKVVFKERRKLSTQVIEDFAKVNNLSANDPTFVRFKNGVADLAKTMNIIKFAQQITEFAALDEHAGYTQEQLQNMTNDIDRRADALAIYTVALSSEQAQEYINKYCVLLDKLQKADEQLASAFKIMREWDEAKSYKLLDDMNEGCAIYDEQVAQGRDPYALSGSNNVYLDLATKFEKVASAYGFVKGSYNLINGLCVYLKEQA